MAAKTRSKRTQRQMVIFKENPIEYPDKRYNMFYMSGTNARIAESDNPYRMDPDDLEWAWGADKKRSPVNRPKNYTSYITQSQIEDARRAARRNTADRNMYREYYEAELIKSALNNRRRHATLARLGGKSPIRRAHEAYDAGVYTVPSHRMIETLARRSGGFSHRRRY